MPEIIHEVEDKEDGFRHRLIVDGVPGYWAGYIGLALSKCGQYHAGIPDYWGEDQPRVYKMVPVEFTVKDVK